MGDKRTAREIAGDILFERRRSVGDAAAKRVGRPTGAEPASADAEREAFWKRFLTQEQEAQLIAKELAEGKTIEQARLAASGAVYKRRWELWADQGELPEQLAWAKRMVKLGPPESAAQESAATSTTPSDSAVTP